MVQAVNTPLILSGISRRAACAHSAVCVTLLLALAALETWTDMDMTVQQLVYDSAASGWPISAHTRQGLHMALYTGPKIALAGLGIACLIGLGASFSGSRCVLRLPLEKTWHSFCRPCVFLLLCLTLVPLLVAGSKQFTNIYCPKELTVFGGTRTYQRLLEPARAENAAAPRGKGFPAGHASGGFALMGLYFLASTPRHRLAGLATGLVAGWIMGTYQLLRGEHFLSHTLASMVAAWLIIVCIAWCCSQSGLQKKIGRHIKTCIAEYGVNVSK